MSGQSPSVVLYTSTGTELDVQTNTAVPAGTGAILISGVTPSGNATWMPATADGVLGITQMSNHQVAQNAATVTTSGTFTTTSLFAGTQEIALVVDVGTVTGAGNITYTIQEIDTVGNLYGNSASTAAISTGNAPGVFTAVLPITTAMNVRVTWTVVSTFSATITSYIITKSTPSTQTINGTITATNPSVSTTGTAVPASATFVGGLVTTAAESGLTSGDLYALNLTTTGQLRIDGVYPLATAVATAVDMGQVGGVVTTAAPTYTTATVNALSLDTSGNLRTSVNNTVTVTGAAASTFNNQSVGTDGAAFLGFDTQVGGRVTTAAPTYTTGNLNGLSLTTLGGLRVDGVYAVGTADATAADVNNVGGYATTAAPTYTTGQLNPLSLDLAGNLRVTGSGGTFNNASVGSDAAAALAFDTQVGGKTTTAAPTYTTGNLDVLSLTTLGGLRVDGVYAAGTANATAADVGVVGGYVTTAAPTYTTGQLEPLSIDTSGNLRVTGFVTTNKSTTAAVTSVAVPATTATSLLAANATRIFASLYNNGTKGTIYILLGAGTVSATNFSIAILANSYWELPVDWTGAVSAFATNASTVLCTELTP